METVHPTEGVSRDVESFLGWVFIFAALGYMVEADNSQRSEAHHAIGPDQLDVDLARGHFFCVTQGTRDEQRRSAES
jgi:hypothetical protein